MGSKRKYRSKVAGAAHEGVCGMHWLGLVDRKTMREFDGRSFTAVDDLSLE
jgi:putative transcriptional regulator